LSFLVAEAFKSKSTGDSVMVKTADALVQPGFEPPTSVNVI
jgi:hypothetical protein